MKNKKDLKIEGTLLQMERNYKAKYNKDYL